MKIVKTKKLFGSLARISRKCDTIERAVERIGYARELENVLGRMVAQACVMKQVSGNQRVFYKSGANGTVL